MHSLIPDDTRGRDTANGAHGRRDSVFELDYRGHWRWHRLALWRIQLHRPDLAQAAGSARADPICLADDAAAIVGGGSPLEQITFQIHRSKRPGFYGVGSFPGSADGKVEHLGLETSGCVFWHTLGQFRGMVSGSGIDHSPRSPVCAARAAASVDLLADLDNGKRRPDGLLESTRAGDKWIHWYGCVRFASILL